MLCGRPYPVGGPIPLGPGKSRIHRESESKSSRQFVNRGRKLPAGGYATLRNRACNSKYGYLTDHLPRRTFRRLVKRYNANHRVRSFTCWQQFLAMAIAQLTYRESPRASARPTTWGDDSSLPSSSRRGNCPATILLEPAVLYIPSTAMYNAAMYTRVSSLAPRDA